MKTSKRITAAAILAALSTAATAGDLLSVEIGLTNGLEEGTVMERLAAAKTFGPWKAELGYANLTCHVRTFTIGSGYQKILGDGYSAELNGGLHSYYFNKGNGFCGLYQPEKEATEGGIGIYYGFNISKSLGDGGSLVLSAAQYTGANKTTLTIGYKHEWGNR
jgi:hypothetical protein